MVNCISNNCEVQIPRSKLEEHLKNDCKSFNIVCPSCKSSLPISELLTHNCIEIILEQLATAKMELAN